MAERIMSHILWLLVVALSAGSCSRTNASYVAGTPCMPSAGPSACGQGTTCDPQTGICACPAGSALCGNDCANLATDATNCGGCGLVCPGGQSCASGRCSGGGCPTGAVDCLGLCIDPKTNAQLPHPPPTPDQLTSTSTSTICRR